MVARSGHDESWWSLLDRKKEHVTVLFGECHKFENFSNGRAFRNALETLCKAEKDFFVPQIATTVILSVSPVAGFAKAVDKSDPELKTLANGEGLEGLVWGIAFALIQVGR